MILSKIEFKQRTKLKPIQTLFDGRYSSLTSALLFKIHYEVFEIKYFKDFFNEFFLETFLKGNQIMEMKQNQVCNIFKSDIIFPWSQNTKIFQ